MENVNYPPTNRASAVRPLADAHRSTARPSTALPPSLRPPS